MNLSEKRSQISDPPKHGVTVRAHVYSSMESARAMLVNIELEIKAARRLKKVDREQFWRDLAGVQADCETVKLWLAAGCPEG